jgi:hypothetical protein
MPRSRLPHGLVKPPTQMNRPEVFILALLGTSVTIGLASMGSDLYRVYRKGSAKEVENGTDQTLSDSAGIACPINGGNRNE